MYMFEGDDGIPWKEHIGRGFQFTLINHFWMIGGFIDIFEFLESTNNSCKVK